MNVNTVAPRPRQADIARRAGVSISTVSRVLANEPGISDVVRQQILRVAGELGYRMKSSQPARALGPALALLSTDQATGGLGIFYEGILVGLRESYDLQTCPLHIRLAGSAVPGPDLIRRLMDETETKCLYFMGVDPSPDLADWLLDEGIPTVWVNGADPQMRFDCVSPANFYGGGRATRYLLDAGHRNLVHITQSSRPTILERARGFQSHIDACPGAVARLVIVRSSTETRHVVADLFGTIRAAGLPMPTAIFCMNDMIAVETIDAIGTMGLRVPDDISVVGFDDLPCAVMTSPRLTTIRVDREELGREAFRLMLYRLANPLALPRRTELAVDIVEGGSVASIAAS